MLHETLWQACSFLSSMFFGNFCAYCKEWLSKDSVFCKTCREYITPVCSAILPVTDTVQMRVFAISGYERPLKQLVLAKNQQHTVAATQLARIMVEELPLAHLAPEVLIPIPLHWTRYAWRGYNQADVIARYIGKNFDVPVISALQRVKKTPFLSALAPAERPEQLRNAFACIKNKETLAALKGKRVVLVDDLCTTGATLKQAAKILLPYKPARIDAIVACRVV